MWWLDGREKMSEAAIESRFRSMALPAFTAATPGARPAARPVPRNAADKS